MNASINNSLNNASCPALFLCHFTGGNKAANFRGPAQTGELGSLYFVIFLYSVSLPGFALGLFQPTIKFTSSTNHFVTRQIRHCSLCIWLLGQNSQLFPFVKGGQNNGSYSLALWNHTVSFSQRNLLTNPTFITESKIAGSKKRKLYFGSRSKLWSFGAFSLMISRYLIIIKSVFSKWSWDINSILTFTFHLESDWPWSTMSTSCCI